MEKKSKKLVIVVILVICILSITTFFFIYELNKPFSTKYPSIVCIKDEASNTLTVKSVNLGSFNEEIYWDNVFVVDGNATIPSSGIIKVNDVIDNCNGKVVIVYEKMSLILFECDFS